MTPGGQGGARPDSLGEHCGSSLFGQAAHPPTGAAGDRPAWARAQPVPLLKLAELLMVILDCRPRLPLATAAALVREHCGEGTLVRVVFLDIPAAPGTAPEASPRRLSRAGRPGLRRWNGRRYG